MIIDLTNKGYKRPELVTLKVTLQRSGIKKIIKLRKNTPRNCSAVRKICISCQKTRIGKNSKQFSSGVCFPCGVAKAPTAPVERLG